MNKFNILINLLGAKLIVFFENDFTPENSYDRVLHDLLFLDSKDILLLFNELLQKGYENLANSIKHFINELNKSIKYSDKNALSIPEDEVGCHLSILKDSNPEYIKSYELYMIIKEEFDSILKNTDEIYSIFNKYGVSIIFPEDYEHIKNVIMQDIPWKSFRVFRNYNESLRCEIKECIHKSLQNEHDFCICIVDNHYSEGYKANLIVSFLKKDLQDKKIASVVFSSRDKGDWSNFPPEYYVEYVSKSDDSLESIARGLAFCSYKLVFSNLKKFNEEALDLAFKMALESKENMEYLACMAYEEGTTPFEVLNKWFDLALKRNVSEKLNRREPDYEMIVRITNFLNSGFESNLYTEDSFSPQFEEELQLLNTYEIFDYYINLQHQPPAPGDIFMIGGDSNTFYVLVGQDCDFTVRPDSTCRNEVYADLLSANFNPYGLNEKTDDSKRGEISFNYFQKDNGQLGALNIKFGDRKVIDFNILDICTFNRNGMCKIPLKEPLHDEVNNIVSDLWKDLYSVLQVKFMKIINSDGLLAKAGLDKIMSIYGAPELQYQYVENEISFPIQRVCRIKGEFKELLVKRYWDYRSRIGYNTINITKIQKINLSYIEYRYPGIKETKEIRINAQASVKRSNKRKKNRNLIDIPWLVNFEDILSAINSAGIGIVANCKNIEINKKSIIEPDSGVMLRKTEKMIDKKLAFGIEITLPYTITRRDGKCLKTLNENITISELTGIGKSEFLNKKLIVFNLDRTNQINILDLKGKNLRKLSIPDEVYSGMYIHDINIEITTNKKSGEISVGLPSGLEEIAADNTSSKKI